MLGQILKLACKVNAEKKATIFLNFSGHVDWLELKVFVNGWSMNADADIYETTYVSNNESLEKMLSILKNLDTNEPQVTKIGECKLCQRDIMQADEFKEIDGEKFCKACVDKLKGAF